MSAATGHDVRSARRRGPNGIPALVAQPAVAGRFPSVILLHERYGLVPHTEEAARKLAARGYVVVAPDLFHAHPDQERLHQGEVKIRPVDADVLVQLEAAERIFHDVDAADPNRLAVIGVCQTGRYPFVYGAAHPLRAAIALYGAAQDRDWEVNERQPDGMEGLVAKLDAPVLGIFGEKDHVISIDHVRRLRDALERHDRTYQITIYADAPHGWLNDTMPGRYRPEIAARTWAEIVEFLRRTLDGTPGDRVRWAFCAEKHAGYDFAKNVRLE